MCVYRGDRFVILSLLCDATMVFQSPAVPAATSLPGQQPPVRHEVLVRKSTFEPTAPRRVVSARFTLLAAPAGLPRRSLLVVGGAAR